jgi:hypothetical protein
MFNLSNTITEKFTVLLNSIFLNGKMCTALYFSKFGAKSLKWLVMGASTLSATSHMRLGVRDHPLQAFSLVEKAEPLQVRFTLRLRDQRSMWIQDGWKVCMHGFLNGIESIMFCGHLDYFQKTPLGGRLNTNPEDHVTPNSQNHWFILFYHVRDPRE